MTTTTKHTVSEHPANPAKLRALAGEGGADGSQ